MDGRRHLTAAEASRELGISRATLYAYVSRGFIRSEPAPGDPRARHYRAEEVQRLKERQEQRRNPAAVVEQALHWGAPLLDSALTLIANRRLFYRGQDALNLSETLSIEEVAGLMWTGGAAEAASLFAEPGPLMSPTCELIHRQLIGLPSVELFQALLPVAASEDLAAYDLRPSAVARAGARILGLLVAMATGNRRPEAGVSIAQRLQASWAPANPRGADLINAALILCADHEFNVSSFTARCVASAGATPYAAVIAGLSALQGVRHGRQTERVELVFREAQVPARARATLGNWLRRGESIPGFGHQLYTEGDPRGARLLRLAAEAFPASPALALSNAIAEQARRLIGAEPNIDFGLATLARAMELPADGGMTLFALGRTVGWIGHAIEEYRTGRIIRPRARYVGEEPTAGPTLGATTS